ncbi:MAG TPA: PP2C family protein-serine/threonine phosphatase [Candidatus Acidoferrum sp.]|nr:PP2C family protein-serine/threonine phosphatase [Candidatus Acidoferrum sp.]
MHTTVSPLDLQALEKLRDEELEEARAIQSAMLPAQSLQAGPVIVSHEFQPMAAVGGDFLDYFELPDGTFGLYLGDVSGKGLPAALYAALAVGTLRGVHKTGTSPGDALALLNRRLVLRGIPRRHVAIQYAIFNPHTHEMHIASAGMPGPLHVSGDECHILRICGTPPGLFAAAEYESVTVLLKPGDSMLFFTDGITDASDAWREQFGMERLHSLCTENRTALPRELLEKVFQAVGKFSGGCEPEDDMAATVFHYSG